MYEFEDFYPTLSLDKVISSRESTFSRCNKSASRLSDDVLVFGVVFGDQVILDVEQKSMHMSWGDVVLIRSEQGHARGAIQTQSVGSIELNSGHVCKLRAPMYEYLFIGAIPLDGLSKALLLSKLPSHIRSSRRFREDASNFLILRSLDKHLKGAGSIDVDMVCRLVDLLVNLALKDYFQSTPFDQRLAGFEKGIAALYRHPVLSQIAEIVQKKPDIDWSVTGLAKRAGLSRSSFCAKFKKVSGVTVFEYITWCRMQHAWKCLCDGEPVCKVSEKVGYLSEPSFNRVFKKTFGETAASVRRRHLV